MAASIKTKHLVRTDGGRAYKEGSMGNDEDKAGTFTKNPNRPTKRRN